MLKSELLPLEECVARILNYYETASTVDNRKPADDLLKRLEILCKEIKEHWIREIFSTAKDYVIRRYVQFHQAGIIVLSDEVFIRAGRHKGSAGAINTLQHVQVLLENLLTFIEERFYPFFDAHHHYSLYTSHQKAESIHYRYQELISYFPSDKISPGLMDALNQSMAEQLATIHHSGTTFREIKYLAEVLNHIQDAVSAGKLRTDSLATLLYVKNFNSNPVETWFRELLLQDAELAGKILLMPVNQDNGLFPERAGIDKLLSEWNTTRLSGALDRMQAAPGGRHLVTMPLNLSVAQLALFIRLCYLEGCFQTSNISGIIRFFTRNFGTKKQPRISSKSFSRAFYGADQATAAILQGYLDRMSAQIDKLYFPKI